MEKSEVIQKKVICTLRWSESIKFYIFTSENIKYTLHFINIFQYFMTLYIIKQIYEFLNMPTPSATRSTPENVLFE